MPSASENATEVLLTLCPQIKTIDGMNTVLKNLDKLELSKILRKDDAHDAQVIM